MVSFWRHTTLSFSRKLRTRSLYIYFIEFWNIIKWVRSMGDGPCTYYSGLGFSRGPLLSKWNQKPKRQAIIVKYRDNPSHVVSVKSKALIWWEYQQRQKVLTRCNGAWKSPSNLVRQRERERILVVRYKSVSLLFLLPSRLR